MRLLFFPGKSGAGDSRAGCTRHYMSASRQTKSIQIFAREHPLAQNEYFDIEPAADDDGVRLCRGLAFTILPSLGLWALIWALVALWTF
jgi:hypothetical protein